jgi:hypothetical protein
VDGGALAAQTLDDDFDRAVMQIQDLNEVAMQETSDAMYDAKNKVIKNVGTPVNPNDAVTKTWAETAGTSYVNQCTTSANNAELSAIDANNSATTATTQAGIATTQATNSAASAAASANSATDSSNSAAISVSNSTTATTQAGIATTQAGIATTQATNSAASATASANSATSSASSFTDFDVRYLGSKTVAPTLDNQGGALAIGALYFDAAGAQMNYWTGSAWSAAYLPSGSYATLLSPTFTGTPTAPTPSLLDNSTKIATTAFLFNDKSAAFQLSTNTTLQSQNSGNKYACGSGAVITLPSAGLGSRFSFFQSPSLGGTFSVVCPSGKNFYYPDGTYITGGSITLGVGDSIDVVADNGGNWIISDMTGTLISKTQNASDNSTKVATTAFVKTSIGAIPAPVIPPNILQTQFFPTF